MIYLLLQGRKAGARRASSVKIILSTTTTRSTDHILPAPAITQHHCIF